MTCPSFFSVPIIFHCLYFLNILWILDFYSALFYILYHPIVAFFHFPLFCFFLLITTTLLIDLFHLFLAHACYLVFIDFKLFKFSFCSSTSSTFFLWLSFFCLKILVFFWLTVSFSSGFLSPEGFNFFLEIFGCLYTCDCYFILQFNLILNILTSSWLNMINIFMKLP